MPEYFQRKTAQVIAIFVVFVLFSRKGDFTLAQSLRDTPSWWGRYGDGIIYSDLLTQRVAFTVTVSKSELTVIIQVVILHFHVLISIYRTLVNLQININKWVIKNAFSP